MKAGVITIFPWRIHREQGLIITTFLQEEGHDVFHLECGGSSNQCFNKLLKNEGNLWGCTKCKLAAINHLEKPNMSSFSDLQSEKSSLSPSIVSEKVISSALSLNRLEYSPKSLSESRDSIEALVPLTAEAYHATRVWVQKNQLDAVFVFNGRMDILRGCFDAVQDLGVRVFSFERTWFGDGIQCLSEENCLGLQKINKDLQEWRQMALTQEQALKAGELISKRLRRAPSNEWRTYGGKSNRNSEQHEPVGLLVIPSSLSETAGHPDWEVDWEDQIDGFNQVVRNLGIPPHEVVVRGHPVWSQKIGVFKANAINHDYRSWCLQNGFKYIDPDEDIDTIELIRRSKVVLLSVSTAAVEAAILGKPVISIGRGHFSEAGFTKNIFRKSDLSDLEKFIQTSDHNEKNKLEYARRALRFVYYMAYRLPVLPGSLKLDSDNKYTYATDCYYPIMTEIITSGHVPTADVRHDACNVVYENEVINLLICSKKVKLSVSEDKKIVITNFNKAIVAKIILFVRSFFKVGDR